MTEGQNKLSEASMQINQSWWILTAFVGGLTLVEHCSWKEKMYEGLTVSATMLGITHVTVLQQSAVFLTNEQIFDWSIISWRIYQSVGNCCPVLQKFCFDCGFEQTLSNAEIEPAVRPSLLACGGVALLWCHISRAAQAAFKHFCFLNGVAGLFLIWKALHGFRLAAMSHHAFASSLRSMNMLIEPHSSSANHLPTCLQVVWIFSCAAFFP